MQISAEDFTEEAREALNSYDKYLVCLNKTNDEFATTLGSLINKAIKAYVGRGDKKNGIALDEFVTVVLTENEEDCPIINIYFNLSSFYAKSMKRKKILDNKKK